MNIIRSCYPQIQSKFPYPIRYDDVIKAYIKMINDKEFMNNYRQLKSGINFKTGETILKNGKIYKKLLNELSKQYNIILLKELKRVNVEGYLKESKRIREEIDEKNREIISYNEKVESVIDQIKKLKKWNDYVIFNGDKYGVPKIFEGIHRENDCFGNIIHLKNENCNCQFCEELRKYGEKTNYSFRYCDKCNYLEEIFC